VSTPQAETSGSGTKKRGGLTDLQLGRMVYKLLTINRGFNYGYVRGVGYRRSKPGTPYFTKTEVCEAMHLTINQADFLATKYAITLNEPPQPIVAICTKMARKRQLKPLEILAVRNQTIRRDLMNAYGIEALLQDGGGIVEQEDDFGRLWVIKKPDQNDLVMKWVEVVNTTPETDGSFSRYFLRVPPAMRSAKQAVAWCGGMTNLSTFGGFAAES
jgi:hypothetical protein